MSPEKLVALASRAYVNTGPCGVIRRILTHVNERRPHSIRADEVVPIHVIPIHAIPIHDCGQSLRAESKIDEFRACDPIHEPRRRLLDIQAMTEPRHIHKQVLKVTDLLRAWADGDERALEELTPRVYDRMRRLAATFLRQERPDHTLQTEALVHEAFLRLVDQQKVQYQNRDQFFANVGRMMRRILVDHARARAVQKRGCGAEHVPEEALEREAPQRPLDLVALDDALNCLEVEQPALAQIVELKFFAGLTVHEIAEVAGLGTATVQRRWTIARAELFDRMSASNG